ncbi:MAG: hypothetical protein LUF25_04885 [Phascolarctobacterium sp.]|nr:hypothetical protein [Phascolarctobacterium sp.]MCD8175858.1 hypothetical protein [Phascolarctobacterium sp.]
MTKKGKLKVEMKGEWEFFAIEKDSPMAAIFDAAVLRYNNMKAAGEAA